MTRRQLPIGIQSFRRIREQDCYYVDKTPHIRRLVDMGDFYFLSRPRRFGKSLLVDTLRELFEANEPLFRGLDIHSHWDWSIKHPVVRLSFGGAYSEPGGLEGDIIEQLESIERHHNLSPARTSDTGSRRLRNILDRLHDVTGQRVVVLVDEYDKPILDVIDNPEMATANRDYLRGFYGIIKDSARDVRFVFVTGVSMFSRVSLFSGLNNLDNISLDPEFATICGYTDADLDTVFAPELPGTGPGPDPGMVQRLPLARGREALQPVRPPAAVPETPVRSPLVRDRLPDLPVPDDDGAGGEPDGTGRSGSTTKPAGVQFRCRAHRHRRAAVPDRVPDHHGHAAGRMAQTFYTLDYPNLEVRQSLNQGLLGFLGREGREVSDSGKELGNLLVANDFDGFADRLRSFFAGIPYQWQGSNSPARYEAWYAGMLYACFRTIGLDLRVEDSSSRGRADMAVLHGGQVFVFEFKMADGEDDRDARRPTGHRTDP